MINQLSGYLFKLFVNRRDCYAKQSLSKQNKKIFTCIKEPITEELITLHLENKEYLGVYQLKLNLVKWGCWDFDADTLDDYNKAEKLYEYLIDEGYHPLMEKSGGGDYKVHIWIFSKQLISAKQMRLFLEHCCKKVGVEAHEIFPKQDEVTIEEYGNLVKLPLGEHLETKKQSQFLLKYKPITDNKIIKQKLQFHLDNLDVIPNTEEPQKKIENVEIKKTSHEFDDFFNKTLSQEIPAGITKKVKIGNKEAGINNNLLKNQARWFYEKGYTEEQLKKEIKPIFDKNGWAFIDLKGWFRKCQKGHITEIQEAELYNYASEYCPDLIKSLPQNKLTWQEKQYHNEFKPVEEKELKPLEVVDMNYFKKLKKEKGGIVETIIGKESLVMWCSPPKNLKSILSICCGLCVATGKEFLGLKTKKSSVLIIDRENNEQIKKDKIERIARGLGIRKSPQLKYLSRKESVDVFSDEFIERVRKTIEKYNIKFIILDTFRRMSPEMREDKSDDVSKFHAKFFIPLRDEYKISCLFLHHTGKEGLKYRGSSDIGGMVDNAFLIVKEAEKKDKNNFKIKVDLSRTGQAEDILGTINFFPDEITFETRAIDETKIENTEALKDITNKIRDFFSQAGRGVVVKKSSINTYLEEMGIDTKMKRGSITRALDFLKEKGEIDMTARGRYNTI